MENDTYKKVEQCLGMMNSKDIHERGNYVGSYPSAYLHDIHGLCPNTDEFMMDDNPRMMMINPKQIYWIRKRRLRREMLDSIMITPKTNYLHESRHRHAMKHLRALSGRFLTKEETAKVRMRGHLPEQNSN